MATTVQSRAIGAATSLSGTAKTITIPSGYAAGDLMTLFYMSAAGAPDANPTGWTALASGNDGNFYWAAWTKTATSGDISGGSFTVNTASAGKVGLALTGHYSASWPCSLLAYSTKQETVSQSTHGINAVTVPGPAVVVSFFGLKDTTTDVSGQWSGPAAMSTPVTANSGGSSAVTVGVASSITNDVPAGSYGGGTSWTVTKADGVTACPSQRAVTIEAAVCAVQRPSADVTNPAGATFVGGATTQAVTADDDPATYVEFSGTGVTLEEKIAVTGGTVPSYVQVDFVSAGGAASSSVHGYLMLGATQLLDLGTDSTLIGTGGRSIVYDLSGLTGGNKTSILADPTNLRIRCVCTVA